METVKETTETESTSSLKYERTKNRDIMETIERINRSVKYRSSVGALLDAVVDGMYGVKATFKELWRKLHASHDNPPRFAVNVRIGSPLSRTMSKTDENGVETPYPYMSMTLNLDFILPTTAVSDEDAASEGIELKRWFDNEFAKRINRKAVETFKAVVDATPHSDRFAYPLLEGDSVNPMLKSIIGGAPVVPGRINVYVHSSIGIVTPDKRSIVDSCPAKDSEFVHDGLISNIATAFAKMDEN